jgi:hypothetical protein
LLDVLNVPLESSLFGATLLGVALFHNRTVEVAAGGFGLIVFYKLLATGFAGAPRLAGLVTHLTHEWVILANLFGLLMGFVLLALTFVLSSFLDNIPAALIGCTVAASVYGRRVYISCLAPIAANVTMNLRYPALADQLKYGWYVAVAYVAGFAVRLLALGWHPHAPHS